MDLFDHFLRLFIILQKRVFVAFEVGSLTFKIVQEFKSFEIIIRIIKNRCTDKVCDAHISNKIQVSCPTIAQILFQQFQQQ